MKVLVVEDDKEIADLVRSGLEHDSHNVEIAENGADGSFLGRSYDYDAIVLDNSLPKKDGLTVCAEIRASGKTAPIIFVTVNDAIDTKLKAFEAGADDYMTKPFSIKELQARLKALSRRPHNIEDQILTLGDLKLDRNSCLVERAGVPISLTRKEFGMLEYFMKNAGKILSRSVLMEHLWNTDSDPFSNTVEAHMRNLRRKICPNGMKELFMNIPTRGYIMDIAENIETRKKAKNHES